MSMKVLREDSEKISIEFSKTDFNNLRNFFISNNRVVIKDLCTDDSEFKTINDLVCLDGAEKGLFDEIGSLLNDEIEFPSDVEEPNSANLESKIDSEQKREYRIDFDDITVRKDLKDRFFDTGLSPKNRYDNQ